MKSFDESITFLIAKMGCQFVQINVFLVSVIGYSSVAFNDVGPILKRIANPLWGILSADYTVKL